MKINFIKDKVKVWGEKDWNNMVNEDGMFEVMNRYGGVSYLISKEDYFGELEKVSSFSDLEDWWMGIIGEDGGGGFGMWLDEVIKEM